MIINNKHIQGIFLYSEDIGFEKGDIVVYEDCMYVCTAKTSEIVTSEIPSDSENYEIYLGNKITTLDEYLNYEQNSPKSEDKYVSSHILSQILNYYISGFNERGIISEYVSYNDGSLSYSESLSDVLSGVGSTDYPLDTIIRSEKLNNCVLRISRSIVDDLLPSLEDVIGLDELDINSIVLRQYTYTDIADLKEETYRVQEIIDHVSGLILYRYSKLNNSIVSPWKSGSVNNELKNQVDYVKNFYLKEIDRLENIKKTLINSFRYKNTTITKGGNSVRLQCSDAGNEGYIEVSSGEDFSNTNIYVTAVIQESISGSTLKRNYSVIVDLNELVSGSVNGYFISDSISIYSTSSGNNFVNLEVSKGEFVNVYYKQNYKD